MEVLGLTQPVDRSPRGLTVLLLSIVDRDRERLQIIDCYDLGLHAAPYMPEHADQEYKLLARRAVSNWMTLLVGTPAQACYVDDFRRGPDRTARNIEEVTPEWRHWQDSRLDAKQLAIHRGALKFGHSFTLTELVDGKPITRGLSAMHTAAVYEDPANDIDPFAALTITRYPTVNGKTKAERTGEAFLYTRTRTHRVTFESPTDPDTMTVSRGVPHGVGECPVTRFAASVDLEGRTMGVIEPAIPVQDRVNQTMFDLLVAQTYGSFKIRTITGMAPPMKRWTQRMLDDPNPIYLRPGGPELSKDGKEPGDVVVDPETGEPVAKPINMSAKRFMFAEDADVEFGSLPETPLKGYIESLDMSIRHLAAMTQTPPHYLLGEIANLSADALKTAETSLLRKVEEFRKSFGESWERVFRLAARLSGDEAAAGDFSGEVMWRDTEMRPLSATADGLSKLAEGLGVPKRGLWPLIPGMTRNQMVELLRLAEEERQAAIKGEDLEAVANIVTTLLERIQAVLPVSDPPNPQPVPVGSSS